MGDLNDESKDILGHPNILGLPTDPPDDTKDDAPNTDSDGNPLPDNGDGGNDRIVLSGLSKDLKFAITHILGIEQLLQKYDLGTFTGYPQRDEGYLGISPLTIKIHCTSAQNPPFAAKTGFYFQRVTVKVPHADPNKINWEAIKNAVGGADGYTFGASKCIYTIDTPTGRRKIQVYASSEDEAQNIADNLLDLSTCTADDIVSTIINTEQINTDNKNSPRYKENITVYPKNFTIINTQNEEYPSTTIDLWLNKKPSSADEDIQNALKTDDN